MNETMKVVAYWLISLSTPPQKKPQLNLSLSVDNTEKINSTSCDELDFFFCPQTKILERRITHTLDRTELNIVKVNTFFDLHNKLRRWEFDDTDCIYSRGERPLIKTKTKKNKWSGC